MRTAFFLMNGLFLFILISGCPADVGIADSNIVISVSGQAYGAPANRSWAHACWIEDESGITIQPLSITSWSFGGPLGVGLPIWNRTEADTGSPTNVGAKTDLDYLGEDAAEIDAVTSASADGTFEIKRNFSFNSSLIRKFYILFEVDRSSNTNEYFKNDRPAYLYKSELIDLDNPQPDYELSLDGWMCNATIGLDQTYDQSPDLGNSDFDAVFKSTYFSTVAAAKYVYVPEPEYLIDSDHDSDADETNDYDDMIFSISAVISE